MARIPHAGSKHADFDSRRHGIAGFATFGARAEGQPLAACGGEYFARDLDRVASGDVDLQLIIA